MVNQRIKWDKKYRESERGKLNSKKVRRKYNKTHYHEVYVRSRTRHMNTKENTCLICGNSKKTQFHHFSYNPNVFCEVCKECHNQLTNQNSNLSLRLVRGKI